MHPNDRLAYERFAEKIDQRGQYPFEYADDTNGMLAETRHFFVVTATGPFQPGYIMIVTKDPNLSSLGVLNDELLDEFLWLRDCLNKILIERFGGKTVHFEHGMCACAGADHAHFHLMAIPAAVTAEHLVQAINETFLLRAVGVEEICIGSGERARYISDRSYMQEWMHLSPVITKGELATLETLKASSPDAASYPQSTTELVWSGRHYVYFHAPGMEQASFICDLDMGSQFGREAVYRAISSALNMPDMHDYSEQGLGWRWQDFPRYEHMLTTMNELTEPLYQLSADAEALAYGFISHLGAIGIPGVADLHDQQPGQDAALGA